jgi:hypothetical protein
LRARRGALHHCWLEELNTIAGKRNLLTIPPGPLHVVWRGGTSVDGLHLDGLLARYCRHERHGGNPTSTLARAQRPSHPHRLDLLVRLPASLCVAVPLGYLRWLLVEKVADEVADAGGEQPTASHGVEVVAVVVVVVGGAENVVDGAADICFSIYCVVGERKKRKRGREEGTIQRACAEHGGSANLWR